MQWLKLWAHFHILCPLMHFIHTEFCEILPWSYSVLGFDILFVTILSAFSNILHQFNFFFNRYFVKTLNVYLYIKFTCIDINIKHSTISSSSAGFEIIGIEYSRKIRSVIYKSGIKTHNSLNFDRELSSRIGLSLVFSRKSSVKLTASIYIFILKLLS